MSYKKGFVLLETVIVLIVTVISMLGLFLTYSFVFKSLKSEAKYDDINDVYKLNIFFSKMESRGFPNDEFLIINSNSNDSSDIVKSCLFYFDDNCSDLMLKLEIDYFIYLNSNMDILSNSIVKSKLNNTDINYFEKLDHNKSHLIGVYKKGNSECNTNNNCEYHYVSLEVGDLE